MYDACFQFYGLHCIMHFQLNPKSRLFMSVTIVVTCAALGRVLMSLHTFVLNLYNFITIHRENENPKLC